MRKFLSQMLAGLPDVIIIDDSRGWFGFFVGKQQELRM